MSLPVLSPLAEAFVKIGSDDAFVKLCPANVFHAVQGILMCVVFNKAEAAWRFAEAV